MGPLPLFVPIPGGIELAIILGLAVLLFGANKIPELARSSGQAMGEFKRGREDLEGEIRDAAAQEGDGITTEETGLADVDEAA